MSVRHRLRPGPWRQQWRAVIFGLVGFPLAIAGALYVAVLLYIGGLAALTIIGLPLVSLGLRGVRAMGAVHRALVERLLGPATVAPQPPGPANGPIGWITAGLIDVVAWRSLLYLLVRSPVAALTFAGAVGTWTYGAFLLVLPVLSVTVMHEPFSGLLTAESLLVGVALLAVAPWATRVTADLNRWLARSLLGPPPASPRSRRLEQARREVAADAAATLRRIERDLHDGTQARLVAIAMSLTLADDALAVGDTDRAQQLIDRARAQLGDATTELRQLTRGINPVALDGGLAEALPTLAADAGIPTDLDVDLPERPHPVIERVVYFCLTELLANAAKHSGADAVQVEVASVAAGEERRLRLRVTDRGRGGAVLGAGSGLRGLRDRLEAVDGTLDVSSPPGGPTVVTAELPAEL